MLLRLCPSLLMTRRKSATACNGRLKRRRESAVRTLVAETLVLAKTHGYVEKIEDELEQELARDVRPPPAERLKRLRREGDKIFKSKYMLLIVVILCILDCALVLGELTLDLHKVKVKLEDTELFIDSTVHFSDSMKHKHTELQNLTPYSVFQQILKATIIWNTTNDQTFNSSCANGNSTKYDSSSVFENDVKMLKVDKMESSEHKADLELLGTIAHAFHYCSITILGVLVIETLLKSVCAGKAFFHRKLEVFDAFIVVMSFLVDFCFIVFLPDIDTKDFVFILAILLPWRVIRVVDSLVVSVKDHEHFRLKLVYKRKKKIQGNLREIENQMQRYRMQVTCLQRLCIMEGIDEWKIDHALRNDGSVPPTPIKKKFRLRFEDSPFGHGHHNRAPRFSLPSLDFHGTKCAFGNNVNSIFNSGSKPRASLPSVAFNTIKQHISKNLPSRRASQSIVEESNSDLANGDIRRKKLDSDDLNAMHDTIHEDHAQDSGRSSVSESGDVFGRSNSRDQDNIRIRTGSSKFTDRHHSVDSDHEEQNKLMKILQDPRRRLSETAVIDSKHMEHLAGFEDILVGKTTQPNSNKLVSKCDSQTSLKVISALKPDPSYSNFEYIDKDIRTFKPNDCDYITFDIGNEQIDTEHRNNVSESAIIECESITINPTGKVHTAENHKNKNHLVALTSCETHIPTVTIEHEVQITDSGSDMPNSEVRLAVNSFTNDT